MKITAPHGPFAHSWQARILEQRPLILPSRSYTYPRQAEEIERGALEVMVVPADGATFLATCGLGFADPLAPTGLWTHPHPDVVCAVAGGYAYLVNTLKPERCEQIPYRPVLGIYAVTSPGPLLLFAGSRTMLAYGVGGRVWESERLSDEGITVTEISGENIEGLGWRLETDREVAFVLDVATGVRS